MPPHHLQRCQQQPSTRAGDRWRTWPDPRLRLSGVSPAGQVWKRRRDVTRPFCQRSRLCLVVAQALLRFEARSQSGRPRPGVVVGRYSCPRLLWMRWLLIWRRFRWGLTAWFSPRRVEASSVEPTSVGAYGCRPFDRRGSLSPGRGSTICGTQRRPWRWRTGFTRRWSRPCSGTRVPARRWIGTRTSRTE
jgi:hypothetical protein